MKKLVLLLGIGLCSSSLCLAVGPSGCPHLVRQPAQTVWTWQDRDHKVHSRTDLDAILTRHKQWIAKYRKDFGLNGTINNPAAYTDPLRADLTGASLQYVDLREADLTLADLSGANLLEADMSRANLYGAVLDHAPMFGACLVEADSRSVDFTGANLFAANFTAARLFNADLTGGVNLQDSIFAGADVATADLSGAYLQSADLSTSFLIGTQLDGANVSFAKFWNTDFEPKSMPIISTIARAEGLRSVRWSQYPLPFERVPPRIWANFLAWQDETPYELPGLQPSVSFLRQQTREDFKIPPARWYPVEQLQAAYKSMGIILFVNTPFVTGEGNPYVVLDLRKALNDAGYRHAELEVNLAYQRGVQSTWQMIFLDWTCEWGATWQRPVHIVCILWLLCAGVYWFLIRFTRNNCLFLKGAPGKYATEVRIANRSTQPPWRSSVTAPVTSRKSSKLRFRMHELRANMRGIRTRLRWEWKVFSTALLFSAMSVLNLGVQGLDLGRWVSLMQKREFTLRARGMIRVLSGLQSVLSFALLALATLSYFGHSFE